MNALHKTVTCVLHATLRRTQRWAQMLGFSILGLAAACGAQAAPQLRCEVTYAGHTRVLTAQPVSDPYSVEAVDIGGRFFFKMAMVGHAAKLEYILIYVYLNQEPRPVIVQQIKYLPPFRNGAQPYLLTGEQHVYAGPVERELIYSCGLVGVKP